MRYVIIVIVDVKGTIQQRQAYRQQWTGQVRQQSTYDLP